MDEETLLLNSDAKKILFQLFFMLLLSLQLGANQITERDVHIYPAALVVCAVI